MADTRAAGNMNVPVDTGLDAGGEVTGQCYPRTIHNNIHLHWAFLICLGSLFSHGGCSLRHLDAAGLMGVVTHRIGHSTLWYDATSAANRSIGSTTGFTITEKAIKTLC